MKYKTQILKYSDEYNLSPNLVASVICVESRFNSTAKSSSGACGLMQLMPSTFSWISHEIENRNVDIFDVDQNIKSGCFYLRYLFDKYKNEIFVLACYNAGETVVVSWGNPSDFSIENIKYTETKRYVQKVISLLWLYDSRFD